MSRLAIVVLCACSKTAAPPPEQTPPKTAAAASVDWTTQPLDATMTGSSSGVAFEVHVPKGWIVDRKSTDTQLANYRPDVADVYTAPTLTIGADAPNNESPSLDAYAARMADPDATVVAKRALPDGYLVVMEDNDHSAVKVLVDKHKGTVWVGCQAMQRPKGAIPAGTAAWLSKICESLAIE